MLLFSQRLIRDGGDEAIAEGKAIDRIEGEPGLAGAQLGTLAAFSSERPLHTGKAWTSAAIFVIVIAAASLNLAPIAACAFAGAVLLIVLRVITADEAYSGLRPDILMLIAGTVVLGIAL